MVDFKDLQFGNYLKVSDENWQNLGNPQLQTSLGTSSRGLP